jgi:hypothetical protein
MYAKDFVGEKNMWGYIIYEKTVESWEEDSFLRGKSVVMHIFKQLKVQGTLHFASTGSANYHPKKQVDILIDGKKV